MKRVITKIFAILTIGLMLINSSLLSVISVAIDSVEKAIDKTKINAIYEMKLEKYVNYDVNDAKGVMTQLNLKTGIEYQEDEEYKPLNSTETEMDMSKINGELPEKVEVIAKSTKATNGDENGKNFEYNYNNQTGKLSIKIQNKADENGNIYSENVNNARDEIEIYAYYGKNAFDDTKTEKDLEVSGKIKLDIASDEKLEIEKEIDENYKISENISGLISTEITTSDIYDGYIKANKNNNTQYETEYTENTKVQIGYKNIADKIEIQTKNTLLNQNDKEKETTDIVYTKTKVNKNEILDKLGEDGSLKILNINGDVLADINKDTEVDENGNIEINYEEEPDLKIELSNPEKIGEINIQNVKKIKSTMTDIEYNKIKVVNTISCTKNEDEETKDIYNYENDSIFEIKEATSDIELNIDNVEWTNNIQNNVTFTATLVSKNQKNTLFENPTIEIKLPSEVEKVVLGDVALLYSDELKIQDVKVVEKNGYKSIVVKTKGIQTIYNSDSLINGINIIIPATVILKKDILAKDENVECIVGDKSIQENVSIKTFEELQYNTENTEKAIESVSESNEDLSKIDIEYKAYLGSTELKNEDYVHEGEYVKYVAKVKNNSNKAIENVTVIAEIPENATYVEITKVKSKPGDYDECKLTEKQEIKKYEQTISLSANEQKTINFYVKVNTITEEGAKISTNIKVKNSTANYEQITNNVKEAEVSVKLTGWETKRDINVWVFDVIITNNTEKDIRDAKVNFEIGEKFKLSKENTSIEVIEKTNELEFSIDNIEAEKNITKTVFLQARTSEEQIDISELSASVLINDSEKYYSNPNIQYLKNPILKITQTSEKEGETLKYGDEIEYIFKIKNESETINLFTFTLKDFLDNNMQALTLEYDNYYLDTESDYADQYKKNVITKSLKDKNVSSEDDNNSEEDVNISLFVPNGEESIIKIKATPKMIFGQKKEVVNYATIEYDYNGKFVKTSNYIKNTILPYDYEDTKDDDNKNDNNDDKNNNGNNNNDNNDNNDNNNNNDNNKDNEQNKTYSISGCVWKDENKNGIRENKETLLKGITVKLFDIENNSIVVIDGNKQIKETDDNGKYIFSKIPKGKYIVLFEYDTQNYKLTKYQNREASETINSDVINKTVSIDGIEKLVAVTDNIDITNNNYVNIDMGLVENSNFNLSINKVISKIQVNYDGSTKEYDYEDVKLAKVEIPAKSLKNATITVEYKIEVKNEGNIEATIDSILDNKPEKLDFNQEKNSNWKVDSNNKLINEEFKGQIIKPGETKSVNLYLTKKLSDDSIGVIINKAQIQKSSNFENLQDNNSNDDYSEAQIIISIKTGAVLYTGIIIAMIIIAMLIKIGIEKKIFSKRNINKISMIILVFFMTNVVALSFVKVYAINCWDSQDEFEDIDYLSYYTRVYDEGTREVTFYTYNYITYGGTEKVDTLFCADGKDMAYAGGSSTEDYWGEMWNYNWTSDKSKVWAIIKDDSTDPASISEANIENKGKDIISKDGYYIVGPFAANFNGAIHSLSINVKKSNGDVADISNVKMCDSNYNDISYGDLSSGNTFYIKVPDNLNIVKINKINLQNKIVKTISKLWSYKYYEVWNDADEHEGAQILNVPKEGTETEDYTEDSYDSVEIAVNKAIVGSIKITKKDSDTASALAGAKFNITGPNNYNKTFTTDSNGQITISNLPIGKYTVKETGAPSGYDLELQSNITQEITVDPAKTSEANFSNRQYGDLEVIKKDKSTDKILTEPGFKFNIYKMQQGQKYYLSSYTEGKPSTLTFTTGNARYTLTTGSDGKTPILKNIPIDTYYIEEIEVPDSLKDYYNVTQDYGTNYIKLVTNTSQKSTFNFYNQQIYTDVAGYVWEDIIDNSKDGKRDNLYTSNFDKLAQGVVVSIKDNRNGSTVKTTTTDNNGQYRFKKVEITELPNYYIEFEYNGLKYESVEVNLSASNGSKAKESNAGRTNFNKSYSTIVEGENCANEKTVGYSHDENGNENNMLNYRSTGWTSTLVQNTGYSVSSADSIVSPSNSSEGVRIIATTLEAGQNLTWTAGSHEIGNINFGIYERAQPDLAIVTDISKIDMTINGYSHTYNMEQRKEYISEGLPDNELNNAYNSLMDGFQVAVKNKAGKYKDMTYTRGIDDAYIAYTKANPESEERLKVYITYKITLKNESSIPYVKVKGLENYADSQLDCVSSYINDDTNNIVKWTNAGNASDSKYNIWKSGEIEAYIESGKTENVYLVYELNKEAIISLANLKQDDESSYILSNTTEITSYSSYDRNKQAYAGIDKDSAPGNIVYGNIATYEDDTDSAPELGIKRKTTKEISGLVFEDETKLNANNERLGDGRYDNGNNTIENVQVKLKKYNDDNATVTLYTLGNNGEVVRTPADSKTKENGKYNFVGIIPGEYYLEYTYGTDTGKITTQDYKSTIIANEKLKQAVNSQSEYWYEDENLSNYSSAVDNWQLRTNINTALKDITYSVKTNYDTKQDNQANHVMVANSGKMDFPIGETKNQTTNYDYQEPSHIYNIKFGVAERPRQDIELSKEISYVKLTLATGEVVLEGDPRTDTIRYVTYPKVGMVKVEMDNDIIQGSRLNIGYAISIENKSETDYNTENYYKYGEINGAKPVETTINKVIDYVDDGLQSEYTNTANAGEWRLKTGNEELKDVLANNVYNEVKTRTTTLINEPVITLKLGEKKNLNTVEVSKLMSSSEDTTYENYAEIISVSNATGRFYNGTPGNFLLTNAKQTHESDDNARDNRAKITVVPSTGDNTIIYYMIGIISLSIIAGGIIFVKRVLKNNKRKN